MNKETARREWNERFNNRLPMDRKSGQIVAREVSAAVTELLIYDEIGFFGVTAKDFSAALSGVKSKSILLRINSPGGDVFDGMAIYNALTQHPAKVTTQIDGLAASAASFIALAGDKVVMSENSLMMAHCAWGLSIGNRFDHGETASILEKIDGQLADIYAKKTGKTPAECLAMMEGEGKKDGTWFTAQEAREWGLADEIRSTDGESEAENALAGKIRAMKCRLALVER